MKLLSGIVPGKIIPAGFTDNVYFLGHGRYFQNEHVALFHRGPTIRSKKLIFASDDGDRFHQVRICRRFNMGTEKLVQLVAKGIKPFEFGESENSYILEPHMRVLMQYDGLIHMLEEKNPLLLASSKFYLGARE